MDEQWLSGRVLDLRPKGHEFKPHRCHCVVSLSKNINPSLVLVQPRKTRPYKTERLLMARKESNQTNEWMSGIFVPCPINAFQNHMKSYFSQSGNILHAACYLFFCRNAEGCTPFMQAVRGRSYPAALVLMDCIKKVSLTKDAQVVDRAIMMSMLYPPGSSLDNSPLHVLCCNDTCSFTWTGAEHINQVCVQHLILFLLFMTIVVYISPA